LTDELQRLLCRRRQKAKQIIWYRKTKFLVNIVVNKKLGYSKKGLHEVEERWRQWFQGLYESAARLAYPPQRLGPRPLCMSSAKQLFDNSDCDE